MAIICLRKFSSLQKTLRYLNDKYVNELYLNAISQITADLMGILMFQEPERMGTLIPS